VRYISAVSGKRRISATTRASGAHEGPPSDIATGVDSRCVLIHTRSTHKFKAHRQTTVSTMPSQAAEAKSVIACTHLLTPSVAAMSVASFSTNSTISSMNSRLPSEKGQHEHTI
jgi:hypothetical protein